MGLPYVSHEEATIDSFRREPKFATEFLNAVLADGTDEELVLALQLVVAARGTDAVARKTGLDPATLQLALSPAGSLDLRTFRTLLEALGLHVKIIRKTDG